MQLLTHIFTSLTAATLLLLLATESHSCLVSHPLDVFSVAETCYESSLLLNNNNDDDGTADPMLANYLRQTTRSLRAAPILRSSSASAFVSSSSSFSSKTTTSSMSSSTQEASNKLQNEANTESQTKENTAPQLALPSTSSDDASHFHKLDVSGGQAAGSGSTVSLDHLGPIVVNQDGTMSRISNWEKMTEIERQNTMRIIGKRNKQRLEALKAAGA